MTATTLAQEQLDAYNARDLERFLACFAEDVRVIRLPDMAVLIEGKAAFGAFYAGERFVHPDLRAELLNRVVIGSSVIDHELIHGLGATPIEMAVMLVERDGLLATVFSIPAKSPKQALTGTSS
ncbi:nuclear transport factor 2 family protein [Devosia sp.]|uniref:nuclear transport factor 2 family protein n=1 Tax=Devosia sp. TaxID=1871048 RepID=UPI003263F3C4